MKKVILTLVLCFLVLSIDASTQKDSSCDKTWDKILKTYNLDELYLPLVGFCGLELRNKLRESISTNRTLDYYEARNQMFSFLDNFRGVVCGVYSGECVKTLGIPDHTKFNTEHSWCQSWGAVGKAKSDLHHLYPVKSKLNSRRNNYPFCKVSKATWEDQGSSFGKSYSNTTCFEPPNWHKGELARSMFYFAIRYSRPIDSEQETFFKTWSKDFPVTEKEYNRNENIFDFQGNRNPFVLYPEFVDLISDF